MYRILKKELFDEKGKIEDSYTYYYVQEKKKCYLLALWTGSIWRWKTITHTECGMCDCYRETTKFKTLKEAEDFVKDVLCPNNPKDQWVTKPIKELSCKPQGVGISF